MAQVVLVLGIIKFLHDLFTAAWIGGLLIMVLITMPGVKAALGKGPETKNVMNAIQKRMNKLVWASILGLIITGILLSNNSPLFSGFFSISNEYSTWLTVKHLLITLMVVNLIVKGHLLERIANLSPSDVEKYGRILTLINLLLGLGVMLLSGLIGAVRIVEGTAP